MSPLTSTLPVHAPDEIATLIATLVETERRLEEVTRGQVDTVAGTDGRTFLLRRAQEQLRYAEAAKESAILDALPAHIALLDTSGSIVSLNDVWRHSCGSNVLNSSMYSVGVNYLEMCDKAQGDDSSKAQAAASGIRAVLCGSTQCFSLEYACHSPEEQRWFLMTATPFPREKPTGAVAMHLNVTERKRAESSSIRLASIVESSGDAIIGKDLNSIITSWNKGAERVFGFTADEMLGTSILRLSPDETGHDDPHILEKIKRNEHVEPFDTQRKIKSGKVIDISVMASPIKDVMGEVIGVSIAARDITKFKKSREELQESEQRFAGAFEHAPNGMALVSTSGRWLRVNSALCRMLGYSEAELLNRTVMDITHPEDIGRSVENRRRALAKEGGPFSNEKRYVHKLGHCVTAIVSTSLIHDGKGLPLYFVTQIQDITERKQAEDALLRSEAELRAMAESMPQMVWMTRPDGSATFFNQRWMDYTGLTFAESLGQGWIKAFHPDDQQRAMHSWELATTTVGTYSVEVRLRSADGVSRWWLTRGVPQRDAAGNVLKWFGTCTDIHDLKVAELEVSQTNDELRQSEEKFRQLAEIITDVFWVTSADLNRMLYVSPAYEGIWNRSVQSLYANSNHWLEAILPEDRVNISSIFATLGTEKSSINVEYRISRPDGGTRWIHHRAFAVRDATGAVVRHVGIASDITERKRIEARMRRLIDSTLQGVIFFTTKGEILHANDTYLKLVGYTREDMELGRINWKALTPPEFAHLDQRALAELAACGTTSPYEKEFIRKDGSRVPILLGAVLFEDSKDEGVCFFIDLTERKKAEAALEKTHNELLETSRLAGMAEVATGVLHNVGNVLNSVNVASTCVADTLRKSKLTDLNRVAALMREHASDLAEFITSDPQGQHFAAYIGQLAIHLNDEQATVLQELAELQKNIEHIKAIVKMQQNFAKAQGVPESLKIIDLLEDALRMNAAGLIRHGIKVVREFDDDPLITIEKHKLLQILVNLIRNAKDACSASTRPVLQLVLRMSNLEHGLRIEVSDNGVGIPPENLTRIFAHGFTTKQEGHGFGLHSSVLAAQELNGNLSAHSDGVGMGATFILDLPRNCIQATTEIVK